MSLPKKKPKKLKESKSKGKRKKKEVRRGVGWAWALCLGLGHPLEGGEVWGGVGLGLVCPLDTCGGAVQESPEMEMACWAS